MNKTHYIQKFLVIVLLILSGTSLFAQEETFFLQPIWSPDGEQIAFVGVQIDEDDNRLSQLFIMDMNDFSITNLTPELQQEIIFNAQWSPDGEKIGFTMDTGIGVIQVSDMTVQNMTEEIEFENGSMLWSPDGEMIAFSVYPGFLVWEVWMMDSQGENMMDITPDGECFYSPTWLSNSQELLLNSCNSENEGLFLFDLESQTMQPVWNEPVISYDVTADEQLIAFTTELSAPEIQIMDTTHSSVINLDFAELGLFPGWNLQDPTWSPVDYAFLFTSHCTRSDFRKGIYIAYQNDLVEVEPCDNGIVNTFPVWSPDASKILYQSDKNGRFDIWLYDLETEEYTNLTENVDSE